MQQILARELKKGDLFRTHPNSQMFLVVYKDHNGSISYKLISAPDNCVESLTGDTQVYK